MIQIDKPMKGYKAFESDWTCRGFQYEVGKIYELPEGEEVEMCQKGFHFCKNPIDVFGYYPLDESTKIAEVEALGDIKQEGTKFVTSKIRIIKEFTHKQLQALILDGQNNTGNHNTGSYNTGSYNSGDCNSGNCNSGNCNSGNYNSGNRNSGSYNSGDCNTGSYNSGNYNSGNCNSGSYNSGDCNTGSYNSGNCNTGSYNSGDCNTGSYNSGNCNSGNCNSGNCNSGNRNSGSYNSGDHNSGDFNSGIFNTNEPKMRAFNRECNMTYHEFLATITYSWWNLLDRIAHKNLNEGDWNKIKALPNYDAKIFEEITGLKEEADDRD